MHHRFYEAHSGIHNGYDLKVTDLGIFWSIDGCYAFRTWRQLKGVTTHDGIDYYDFGPSGFLWVPVALADYPRTPMLAFIEKKLSENQ